jgi:hypothetical protein
VVGYWFVYHWTVVRTAILALLVVVVWLAAWLRGKR